MLWQPEVIAENPGHPYNYQYGAGTFTDLVFTGAGAWSPNLQIIPYQVEYLHDNMGVLVDSVFEKWKEHDCSRLAKELDTMNNDHTAIFLLAACTTYYTFIQPIPVLLIRCQPHKPVPGNHPRRSARLPTELPIHSVHNSAQ